MEGGMERNAQDFERKRCLPSWDLVGSEGLALVGLVNPVTRYLCQGSSDAVS